MTLKQKPTKGWTSWLVRGPWDWKLTPGRWWECSWKSTSAAEQETYGCNADAVRWLFCGFWDYGTGCFWRLYILYQVARHECADQFIFLVLPHWNWHWTFCLPLGYHKHNCHLCRRASGTHSHLVASSQVTWWELQYGLPEILLGTVKRQSFACKVRDPL